MIDACPVNGPAVAASGDTVAVAWFSQPGEDGHAFVAFSQDGGRTFGAPARVDDVASLGHVGVALLDDGAAVVTWVEFDKGASFRARRVDRSGTRGAPLRIAGEKGHFVSGIPRVTRQGDALRVCLDRKRRGRWVAAREGRRRSPSETMSLWCRLARRPQPQCAPRTASQPVARITGRVLCGRTR
jgi:hypothetical protein